VSIHKTKIFTASLQKIWRKIPLTQDLHLVEHYVMLYGRQLRTFWRIIVPPSPSGSSSALDSLTLKMNALWFFKTSINIYQSTWLNIPETWIFSNTAVRTSNLQCTRTMISHVYSFLLWQNPSWYKLCVCVCVNASLCMCEGACVDPSSLWWMFCPALCMSQECISLQKKNIYGHINISCKC
jgi:hypothetical protein